jgi:hypothetical protein
MDPPQRLKDSYFYVVHEVDDTKVPKVALKGYGRKLTEPSFPGAGSSSMDVYFL